MTKETLKHHYDLCIIKSEFSRKQMGKDLRNYISQDDGMYFMELNDPSLKPSLSLDHIFVWTNSFFTGMSCLAYEHTNDQEILSWLNQFYDQYYDKVYKTPLETMHDTGFLFSPYAVALYKITGDLNMKRIGIQAANILAQRYFPRGNYIRAWGRLDDCIPSYVEKNLAKDHFFTQSKGLAIIDSMMNIPLLYWASKVTGIPYYANIASSHADMTLKHFIRDDYTTYHAYRFDVNTGKPIGSTGFCGYSDDSYWARGASWAIYGFVIAYGYTKDLKYLDCSIKLANKFLQTLGDDVIPLWDFALPSQEPQTVDTSAAAIFASACIELAKYDASLSWLDIADTTLEALSQPQYLNTDPKCPALLRENNGRGDYWICADYYYMEALAKRLNITVGYW